MPIVESSDTEFEGLVSVARLMMISARTAPKSGGKDDVETLLIYGEEKDMIADEMEKIGKERDSKGFLRDSRNVRDSAAVVLIGVEGTKSFGLNCGGCGFKTCAEFDKAVKGKGLDFKGPNCIFKSLDMGIALGSAAKTAMDHNADNRIMYRIGTAAMRLGFTKKSSMVMGIPLSAKGKSIYFDRPQ
ncbi:MAG: ferredoxin domain-containing protein [Candidatus Bathyarchaeia archaeon]